MAGLLPVAPKTFFMLAVLWVVCYAVLDGTQGFAHTMQVLYPWAAPPAHADSLQTHNPFAHCIWMALSVPQSKQFRLCVWVTLNPSESGECSAEHPLFSPLCSVLHREIQYHHHKGDALLPLPQSSSQETQ
jgi:hypothetical protein